MFFVVGKSSNYSAYDTDGLGQLSDMRDSFEESMLRIGTLVTTLRILCPHQCSLMIEDPH